MVYTLIENDIRHHSDQNFVDSRGAATVDFFFVGTLIDNSKLTNQIATLQQIVVIFFPEN